MNFKFVYSIGLVLLVAISAILITQNVKTPEAEALNLSMDERQHQELIFVLQYISRDYQNAVQDGSVINEFEYQEMMAFSQRAIELYLSFRPNPNQNFILFQLQQLRELLHKKADRHSIQDVAKTLISDLAEELDIRTFPAQTPDIKHGKVKYKEGGCSVCHGEAGAGDGRAAAWLDPGPGSFRDPVIMNEATPYEFFNMIRLGVAGTGMPSYEEAFSEQAIWDIAFYLMTLREDFEPKLIRSKQRVTLKELATRTNVELLDEINEYHSSGERIDEMKAKANSTTVDFLRQHPDALEESNSGF